jgi:hypothetical protein
MPKKSETMRGNHLLSSAQVSGARARAGSGVHQRIGALSEQRQLQFAKTGSKHLSLGKLHTVKVNTDSSF